MVHETKAMRTQEKSNRPKQQHFLKGRTGMMPNLTILQVLYVNSLSVGKIITYGGGGRTYTSTHSKANVTLTSVKPFCDQTYVSCEITQFLVFLCFTQERSCFKQRGEQSPAAHHTTGGRPERISQETVPLFNNKFSAE